MVKIWIFVGLIGLFMTGIGSYEATQDESTRAFLLVGFGSTISLIAASQAGK